MLAVGVTNIYCPTQTQIMSFRRQATEVSKLYLRKCVKFDMSWRMDCSEFLWTKSNCNLMAQTKVSRIIIIIICEIN